MTLIEKLKQFPIQQVDLNGDQQAYREAGTGDQYLVLLHGISSGSGSWVNQLDELSQHFHVIAWDAPGYGLSDALVTQTPNAEDYAQRLLQLFDALQIQQAIVVGHSLGALQASAFAHLYPHRVKTLLIANVAQGYQRYCVEQQAEVYAKRPKMLAELGKDGMARTRGPNLTYVKAPQTIELIQQVMQNLQQGGFTQASYLLAYDEIRNYLKDLAVQCVVVSGLCDSITPPQAIADLAREIGCQNYVEIANAGHLSYVDQPQAFNAIILSARQHGNERSSMSFQVEGKVAVVTGGSSGIGLAAVEILVAEGAKVAWCGRDEQRLAESQRYILNKYPKANVFTQICNVLDPEDVRAFSQAVKSALGGIDMLINNAGQGRVSNFDNTQDNDWMKEIELKYFSVLHPIRAFLDDLKQSEIASITNVNSLLALQPEPHMIATSAARAALLNLTHSLSHEFMPHQIRVNSILLGMVESAQWKRRYETRSDPNQSWDEWIGNIAKKRGIPMQRLGKPEEPAHALVFLASPLASYTTGTALDVSGGFNKQI